MENNSAAIAEFHSVGLGSRSKTLPSSPPEYLNLFLAKTKTRTKIN